MEQIGDIAEGYVLLEWLFKEGDVVTKGATLCVIELGKATVDIESPKSGILHEIAVKPGQDLSAGDLLCKIM
ncbi:MAG: lipoyl domain-containing protein [Sphaerochaetaceae bacterium]